MHPQTAAASQLVASMRAEHFPDGRTRIMQINSKEYWEARFSLGDWEDRGGREQTKVFTQTQRMHLKLPPAFSGTLLDFGCGLGDAMPLHHAAYPNATLIGVDVSGAAIAKCITEYGRIAKYIEGDHSSVPDVDVIIASNVLEHLSDDVSVA